MTAKRVKVIVKPVGKAPHVEWVSNELESFQKLVAGYVEAVTVTEDMAILCNEEGRLDELPFNCELCGINFVGDIVLVGVDGEEFADCPLQLEVAKALFQE